MRYAEVLAGALVDLAQNGGSFAQTTIVEQHMRRQRVRAAADRPNVQIVNSGHAGNSFEVLREVRAVHVARNAFEQHFSRVAHEAHDADDDDCRNEEGEQRIDPGDARQSNRDSAGNHGQRAERVAEDVKEGRADVHVAFARRAQRDSDAGVDGKPDCRDDRHHPRVWFDRCGKATHREVHDSDRCDEQNRSIDEGAEHFDAAATARLVPMQRAGRAQEVAELVSFLAGETAGYITGQVISINGGML